MSHMQLNHRMNYKGLIEASAVETWVDYVLTSKGHYNLLKVQCWRNGVAWYSTREVVTWHTFTLWCWCDGHTFNWASLSISLHSILFAVRDFPIYHSCQSFILFYSKVLLFPTFPSLGFLLSQNKIKLFIQSRVCFHLLGIEFSHYVPHDQCNKELESE